MSGWVKFFSWVAALLFCCSVLGYEYSVDGKIFFKRSHTRRVIMTANINKLSNYKGWVQVFEAGGEQGIELIKGKEKSELIFQLPKSFHGGVRFIFKLKDNKSFYFNSFLRQLESNGCPTELSIIPAIFTPDLLLALNQVLLRDKWLASEQEPVYDVKVPVKLPKRGNVRVSDYYTLTIDNKGNNTKLKYEESILLSQNLFPLKNKNTISCYAIDRERSDWQVPAMFREHSTSIVGFAFAVVIYGIIKYWKLSACLSSEANEGTDVHLCP